jgi:hypothetical protein
VAAGHGHESQPSEAMNSLTQIAACLFLLDILRGAGAGNVAQQKARKLSAQNLLLELEMLKEEVHSEFNSRFPKKK